MELRIIWEIIRQRKWIIIQAFLIVFLTSIIGSFFLPSVYESSSVVVIKSTDTVKSMMKSLGMAVFEPKTDQTDTDTEIGTRMELLKVNPVLDEVISKLQLRDDESDLMKPEHLIESKFIRAHVSPTPYVEIEQVEDSNLIKINADSCDRDEAAIISELFFWREAGVLWKLMM